MTRDQVRRPRIFSRCANAVVLTFLSALVTSVETHADLPHPNLATEELPPEEIAPIVNQYFSERDDIWRTSGSRTYDTTTGQTTSRSYSIVFRADKFGEHFCRSHEVHIVEPGSWVDENGKHEAGSESFVSWERDRVARLSQDHTSCDEIDEEDFFQIEDDVEVHMLEVSLEQFKNFTKKLPDLTHDYIGNLRRPDCSLSDLSEDLLRSLEYHKTSPISLRVEYYIDYPCLFDEWGGVLNLQLLMRHKVWERHNREWEWTDYEFWLIVP